MSKALGVAMAATLLSSLVSSVSFAQTPQEMAWCRGKEGALSPDLRIRSCTSLIQSGNFRSKTLAHIFISRALAHDEKGDLERAIEDFTQAIRLNPQDARTIGDRANAYRVKGDLDRAIQDYDEAIRLNPRDGTAFNNRANAYLEKGDLDRAIEDYDRFIRWEPQIANAFEAFHKRCLARGLLGRLADALADCDESLRLRARNASLLGTRGLIYLKSGRLADATADYDAALRLDPRDAHSLYGRGIVKQRNGDTAGGAADIAAAMMIQADVPNRYKAYGVE